MVIFTWYFLVEFCWILLCKYCLWCGTSFIIFYLSVILVPSLSMCVSNISTVIQAFIFHVLSCNLINFEHSYFWHYFFYFFFCITNILCNHKSFVNVSLCFCTCDLVVLYLNENVIKHNFLLSNTKSRSHIEFFYNICFFCFFCFHMCAIHGDVGEGT